MLTAIFYIIIAPAAMAFFLGFSAHGLKSMTTSVEADDGDEASTNPISAIADAVLPDSTEEPTEESA